MFWHMPQLAMSNQGLSSPAVPGQATMTSTAKTASVIPIFKRIGVLLMREPDEWKGSQGNGLAE